MALPDPEPGLVISYAYLWHREHVSGQEEGRKNRPSVIVLSTIRAEDGATIVTVLPITHSPPTQADHGVEIPAPVKSHLGLDGEPSWVVVTEGNRFEWPGYDLRPIQGTTRHAYGFLPPRFFARIMHAFFDHHKTAKTKLARRE